MLESVWLDNISAVLLQYRTHLVWSVILLVTYSLLTRLALPLIESKVIKSNLKSEAVKKANHITRVIAGIVFFALLLIVWGIDFSGLLLISTSLLTLTGVALFASWSLLSNVTSYFVLLFQPSFRRGNYVRIVDGDNYIEGYIAEVNLFNAKLITDEREIIVYPNNLILTRPSIINPRARFASIGKFPLAHFNQPNAVQDTGTQVPPVGQNNPAANPPPAPAQSASSSSSNTGPFEHK
ncbi:mechanosensitive ion channel domain-containing protein [Alteromonas oceanisediminis]|uniref:mechanosensitive ion channel domain-containing protein n=1 Tax=Alteromonas oceanisediminis TaxID=2836180 RepID=UPI001BD95A45|nr:mechanosensitive ion channel domain-containing protein [Alteromonas oceanisediminis]MBT0585310.1 mechanosensitive ion channel family protein [Alteromonas oceanisediminis]